MANDNKELVSSMLRKMTKLNYIKPGDVPGINLYMDQVTTFMDEHLSDSKRHEDDKILTKTMINNYTKNNLLPPPVKKKYSRDHLYILAFIYYLKNLLSISDIQKLINPLTENCFDTDKTPDMEDIYREVFNLCKSQAAALSRDTLEKARIAGKSFEYVEDEEQRDFLELFSLISLLSFDVYMKKNMIETLIDDYSSKHIKDNKSNEKDNIIKSRMIVTSPYTKLWKIILYNHPGFLFTQLSFILLFLPAY